MYVYQFYFNPSAPTLLSDYSLSIEFYTYKLYLGLIGKIICWVKIQTILWGLMLGENKYFLYYYDCRNYININCKEKSQIALSAKFKRIRDGKDQFHFWPKVKLSVGLLLDVHFPLFQRFLLVNYFAWGVKFERKYKKIKIKKCLNLLLHLH